MIFSVTPRKETDRRCVFRAGEALLLFGSRAAPWGTGSPVSQRAALPQKFGYLCLPVGCEEFMCPWLVAPQQPDARPGQAVLEGGGCRCFSLCGSAAAQLCPNFLPQAALPPLARE